jgi:hypothetical protein
MIAETMSTELPESQDMESSIPTFLELDRCGRSDLTPTCSLPRITGKGFPEGRTRYPAEAAFSSSPSTTSLRVSSISNERRTVPLSLPLTSK